MEYDFSGWATRNDLKCSDGRTIRRDAFKGNDGQKVPLVWNHQHNDVIDVLGHALLKNCPEGVRAYCKFNDTESGQTAKLLVDNGDVSSLSIYANQLRQNNSDVLHGNIREVSLVLAGANPGAYIDDIVKHSDDSDGEARIYPGEDITLSHSDEELSQEEVIEHSNNQAPAKEEPVKEEPKEDKMEEKTIGEVFDTLNEEQKNAVYAIIGEAIGGDAEEPDDEGEPEMKHNVFENDNDQTNVLSHDAMDTIITDAKRYGSMKDSFLAHADEYGIDNIDYLFPDAKDLNMPPEFISRQPGDWVNVVMNGVHHTPFSRIKSMFADITEDDARAKGYIKGKMKKDEVFALLKRSTTPTTIYKKQKMDRDDVVDITDFDVIAWLKTEMRGMLNEEIARAILIGDGRSASSDDKINEQNIRPIMTDADLFSIKWGVDDGSTNADLAKNMIKEAIRARKEYRGSGNPVLFTTEDILTEMLLLEDTQGYRLYKSESELATAMRVSRVIPVSAMENLTFGTNSVTLYGIIVNLNDYNVGADKGGAINMFDDFDIDYNQQKYLIETRCSGALIKPFSAIVLHSAANSGNAGKTVAQSIAEYKN